ncbi:MAG: hypothetical protein SOT35_04285 [Bullifex sp.]|nr:hypothetical protein [Bullifex sp.]
MKKFSVLFVAMLIALMLFVGCENKPKERAATTEDAEIVAKLYMASEYLAEYPTDKVTVTFGEENIVVSYDNAALKKSFGEMKIDVVINGKTTGSFSDGGDVVTTVLDLTTGTKLDGKAHTLYLKEVITLGSSDPSKKSMTYEIILDGCKLTDIDKIELN